MSLAPVAPAEMGEALLHPISPLEGEMPGRAEGGALASYASVQVTYFAAQSFSRVVDIAALAEKP